MSPSNGSVSAELNCGGGSAAPSGSGRSRESLSAFSLLEVLAVLVVMAVLAGTMGMTLRHPGGAVGLQSGQTTLASLCGAARLQAALRGQNSRVVIAADPADVGCYLRYLQVVHEDLAHPGCWLAPTAGVLLAPGVFVVPPPAIGVPGNPAWPAARHSTALATPAQGMTIDGAEAGPHYFVHFTPRGTTGGGTLILAAGRSAGDDSPVLDNPDDVRGVLLRPSGACTMLNDAGALGL